MLPVMPLASHGSHVDSATPCLGPGSPCSHGDLTIQGHSPPQALDHLAPGYVPTCSIGPHHTVPVLPGLPENRAVGI